jgi:hypothetical protein
MSALRSGVRGTRLARYPLLDRGGTMRGHARLVHAITGKSTETRVRQLSRSGARWVCTMFAVCVRTDGGAAQRHFKVCCPSKRPD